MPCESSRGTGAMAAATRLYGRSSAGSHVLSVSGYPSHLTKHSDIPDNGVYKAEVAGFGAIAGLHVPRHMSLKKEE